MGGALNGHFDIYRKANEKSAAHPNPLLAKVEAEYAVKIIVDTLIFVDKVEKEKLTQVQELPWNFTEVDAGDVAEIGLPF